MLVAIAAAFAVLPPASAQPAQDKPPEQGAPAARAEREQLAAGDPTTASADSESATQPQESASALPRLVVEGRRQPAELRRAGVNELSDAPLAQTPLAVSVIPLARMRERGVNSVSSAIRDEPAAGDAYNTFGYVESLQVRGFVLDEFLNYRRDGMPVSSHAPVALENKQAIEILKGLSGIVAGTSAPGGIVNVVVKRPTDSPLHEVLTEVSERGSVLVHGDFGGRTGEDDRYGYRVNVAAQQRRPYADDAWAQRGFASGFFDWRVRPGTTAEFEFERHDVRQTSVPAFGLLAPDGASSGTILPPPIDPRINLNNQPWTLPFESRETTGSLRLVQQLPGDWRLRARFGMQQVHTNDRIAFPDGCSAQSVYVYPGLCANGDVDIYDFRSNGERRVTRDADLDLDGHAATGAVDHELRFGLRTTRYRERYPLYQAYNFVGTENVFAPVALPSGPTPATVNVDRDLRLVEASAVDVMRFAQRWSAWLGARATRLWQQSIANDGSETESGRQYFATPFAALGLQPWDGGFAYASAGSGIETEVVPNRPQDFANPGAVLPAMRSRQAELGFKQVGDRGDGWSVALFRIVRPMADDVATAGGLPLRVAGAREARHDGIEFAGTWRTSPSWLLEARASVLDARIDRASDPALVGRRETNVAPWAFAVRAAWQTPRPGLSLSNQFNVAGRKPVLPDDSVVLPASWQWDAALQWRVPLEHSTLTWLAGVDNVTNRRYWREAPTQPWGATYLFPAAPRTYRVAASVAW